MSVNNDISLETPAPEEKKRRGRPVGFRPIGQEYKKQGRPPGRKTMTRSTVEPLGRPTTVNLLAPDEIHAIQELLAQGRTKKSIQDEFNLTKYALNRNLSHYGL